MNVLPPLYSCHEWKTKSARVVNLKCATECHLVNGQHLLTINFYYFLNEMYKSVRHFASSYFIENQPVTPPTRISQRSLDVPNVPNIMFACTIHFVWGAHARFLNKQTSICTNTDGQPANCNHLTSHIKTN